MLVPLTGIIFKLIHRSCNKEIVADPVALLLTDVSDATMENLLKRKNRCPEGLEGF